MSIRFTQGTNLKSTRTLSQAHKVPPPQSNSMKGLPGFIKTTQDPSSSGLTGRVGSGKSAKVKDPFVKPGIHREGPIGVKGKNPLHKLQLTKNAGGSTDKHYRQSSTGPAGRIVGNKGTPIARKPVDQRSYGSPHGGARSFKQIGGGSGGGHPGRMEKLRGRARMSSER